MNPIETLFFSNNMLFFVHYDQSFCTSFCQFNIGDNCTSIHLDGFLFLMNLEFCLWKTISNSVLINIFFMTELPRIKECSPIPPSYLLNSVHLTPGSKSVSSVWATTSCQVVFCWLEQLFICNMCIKVLAAHRNLVGWWLVTDSAVISYSNHAVHRFVLLNE